MSHDRGCFKCNEDRWDYKHCRDPDCPQREKPVIKKEQLVETQPVINFTWETIHQGIDVLAYMMKPMKIELIVGIARGGLIPATMLSHRFNIPLVVAEAKTYEGTRMTLEKPTKLRILGSVNEQINQLPPERVAVVDDIYDSGNTTRSLVKLFPKARYLHLVHKQPEIAAISGNLYFANVPLGVWVNFPWEIT
jgi:hypoxanthine phosphoribosyltransferase